MSIQAVKWACDARHPKMTLSNKAVLMLLGHHHNWKTGRCNPTIESMADDLACNEKTIRRSLTELLEMGLIERDRQRTGAGRKTGYFYRLPVSYQPDSESTSQPVRKSTCSAYQPDSESGINRSESPVVNSRLYIHEKEEEREDSSPTFFGEGAKKIESRIQLLLSSSKIGRNVAQLGPDQLEDMRQRVVVLTDEQVRKIADRLPTHIASRKSNRPYCVRFLIQDIPDLADGVSAVNGHARKEQTFVP